MGHIVQYGCQPGLIAVDNDTRGTEFRDVAQVTVDTCVGCRIHIGICMLRKLDFPVRKNDIWFFQLSLGSGLPVADLFRTIGMGTTSLDLCLCNHRIVVDSRDALGDGHHIQECARHQVEPQVDMDLPSFL